MKLYVTNYPDRLREAGFQVEVVDYSKELPKEQYRIPKEELLYVVRKK
ncbi:MAG: hypothetical protein WDZ35_14265 [Crocinitomicaceae bacterium]